MLPGEPLLIGLGSNVGDRRRHLLRALADLSRHPGLELEAVSRIFVTAAWGGPPGQGDFLNAAARFTARDIEPRAVLELIKEIEARSGRVRTVRNGPRTLDLDILLFGARIIRDEDLEIPHPGLCQRSFVLGPVAEIAGELVHPERATTLSALARRVGSEGILDVLEEKDWFHAVGHSPR